MKKKSVILAIFLTFFLYSFLIFSPGFRGPDEPIYLAYTASVVEDGDLNAVKYLDEHYPYYLPSGKVGISKTYNLPDFHNYGGVFFWAPFYGYAKFVYFIGNKFNLAERNIELQDRENVIKCALSFSTVVFGIFALILTYFLCRQFFSKKISFISVLMLFFSTPFFYYTFFEVANANMVAAFCSVISILFYLQIVNKGKMSWFMYGLFFSICITVKIDLWFQCLFILALFIYLAAIKKIPLVNGVCFLTGLVPGIGLKIINDFIKYGTLHSGEIGILNFKDYYLFEQLFSSYRGFFYTSPIFYICLLGALLIIINLLKKNTQTDLLSKKINIIFVFLFLYVFTKIIILGCRYAWGGGTCGARPLITEYPVFVLLYAYVLKRKKGTIVESIFYLVSFFCVIWNLLIISEYIARVDLGYVSNFPGFLARLGVLKNISYLLFCIQGLKLKLVVCIPLFLLFSFVLFYILKIKRKGLIIHLGERRNGKFINIFYLFTVYLCASHIMVTLLNVINNKRNVESLKSKGFFTNHRIINPHEFEKIENLGSIDEMIEYFTLKGDEDRVNKLKKYKIELYPEPNY